jgi:hypothetical protein
MTVSLSLAFFFGIVTLARGCGCGCTACGCVVRFFFGAVSLWHAIAGVVAQRVALVLGCSMWPRLYHVVAVVDAAECVSCLGKTKCTELGTP